MTEKKVPNLTLITDSPEQHPGKIASSLEKVGEISVVSGRAFLDMGRCFSGQFSAPSPMEAPMPCRRTLRNIGAGIIAASSLGIFVASETFFEFPFDYSKTDSETPAETRP